VLVETVGVGQSEIAVAGMTDAFVLLVAPAGGDELQGIKRGIMELADLLVVNKCDGALAAQAQATLADYTSAMRLLRPATTSWTPEALAVSAHTGLGVADVWDSLVRFRTALVGSGEFAARRREQRVAWLWSDVTERLADQVRSRHDVAEVEAQVRAGTLSIARAAARLLGA
jgi:LAO/AO transport system kinase